MFTKAVVYYLLFSQFYALWLTQYRSISKLKLEKAIKRDYKSNKRIHGMRVDGSSVKNIERIQKERAIKIQQKRREREELEGE
jgi:hypothetical protein